MTETGATPIGRNPWKITAIGMGLVMATALVTGLVVAGRAPSDDRSVAAAQGQRAETEKRATAARTATEPQPPRAVAQAPAAPRVPDEAAIKACNDRAAAVTGQRDKTTEVVKDGAVGALLGAAVGAAGGAIADGGKGAGKGAAIGGLVGAGAGALYGVNDNRKHDAAYRDAYAACLRSRGYGG